MRWRIIDYYWPVLYGCVKLINLMDLFYNTNNINKLGSSSTRIRKGSRDSQRDFVIIVNKSNTENNFLNVA